MASKAFIPSASVFSELNIYPNVIHTISYSVNEIRLIIPSNFFNVIFEEITRLPDTALESNNFLT